MFNKCSTNAHCNVITPPPPRVASWTSHGRARPRTRPVHTNVFSKSENVPNTDGMFVQTALKFGVKRSLSCVGGVHWKECALLEGDGWSVECHKSRVWSASAFVSECQTNACTRHPTPHVRSKRCCHGALQVGL
jgi:hypothetical protein